MNVFISYSVHDTAFVRQIADSLKPIAEKVLWWDESNLPGEEVWPTIFNWIDQCDLVLAVITENTLTRAMAVGNEIGHAKGKRKAIIPLVSGDVKATELGCLSGITYVPIDRDNPGPALASVQKQIERIKQSNQDQLLVLLGVVALIWLANVK